MKKLYILITGLFLFAFLAFFTNSVRANLGYQGGEYTNLCGTGTAATADSCHNGCDTGSGSCSGTAVAKFVCDGRQTDCRSNESWGTDQNVNDYIGQCNKTVQLDVYTEKCRLDNGNWKDGCNPVDYMVWYSGDCTTPAPPSCNYSSTQARVQRNLSDPWDTSKTINLGNQIRVGGFHDGTGLLANDINLNVSGIGNVGNGSFITPSTSGTYTLTVTTSGQSGSACQDTASFTVQAAACVPNGSCSAPAPTCGTTTTGVDNCGNACSKQGSACPQGCIPNGSCSASVPTACGQFNYGVDNCNNVCIRQSAACPVTAVQTFGNVGVAAPQVVAVKELPKTGLPAIAWSALALIPAGFRMRGFRKIKKDLEDDPQFIWENRQFKGRV